MSVLTVYLRQIEALGNCLLDRREEVRLAKKKDAGNKLARERLIQSQLLWVVHLAKHNARCQEQIMENIQQGNLGLIIAVDKFDHTEGARLSTYSTWWIRQKIFDGVQRDTVIHIPRAAIYPPRNRPSKPEVLLAIERATNVRSLSDLDEDSCYVSDGVDYSLLSDERLDNRVLSTHVLSLIAELQSRNREIILRRMRRETLAVIAEDYGISRERVRQIYKESVVDIRNRAQVC